MRRFPTLLAAGLLAAGGLLVIADEAAAQRRGGGGNRGGWSGGGYNRGGWYGSGYRGGYGGYNPGWGYGGYGYGYPGVSFGGRNWGITVPFGGYGGSYYSARPYYSGGYYSEPYYPDGYYSGGSSYPADSGYYAQAPAQDQNTAEVMVRVPDPNAQVMFNGHQTQERGTQRVFHTAPLEPGYTYSYDVTATWQENGRPITRQQTVQIQPGGRAVADFTGQRSGSTAQGQFQGGQLQTQPPAQLEEQEQPRSNNSQNNNNSQGQTGQRPQGQFPQSNPKGQRPSTPQQPAPPAP